MVQEFFKETLVSKFIKYLLGNTPLPKYPYIKDNQYMLQGTLYTYKEKILLCTSSGFFHGINGGEEVIDTLTVNNELRCADPFNTERTGYKDNQFIENYQEHINDYYNTSAVFGWMILDGETTPRPLAVTDLPAEVKYQRVAEFKIVDTYLFKEVQPNTTQVYKSVESFYGPQTHKMLGEYLRFLKNVKNLDLMSQYNCFNYEVVKDICIRPELENMVVEEQNKNSKILLVPVKFNTEYTIAIDSASQVLIHPVFYRDGNLMKDKRNQYYLYQDLFSSEVAQYQTSLLTKYNVMNFCSPKTCIIRNYDANLMKYEKYLYLAIQVSITNNSSVVVLEGNFTNNKARVISDVSILSKGGATTDRLSDSMSSNLSLLAKNDNKQHPFSDSLIQYLCRNTIDDREYIAENVERVVDKLGTYNHGYHGQWTDYLRYTIYNRMHDYIESKKQTSSDILGYVTSDVEKALEKGYMKRGS